MLMWGVLAGSLVVRKRRDANKQIVRAEVRKLTQFFSYHLVCY